MSAHSPPNAAKVVCVGHAVHDFVFYVDRFPADAGKHRATNFKTVGGGPAATAAVTIARLGGKADLVARLGDDAVGRMIAADLEASGVDCRHVRRFEHSASSVSTVMVDSSGERLIVNYLDRQLPTGSDWIPSVDSLGAKAVLADTRWPSGAAHVLSNARALGLPAILDADVPVAPAEAAVQAATHIAFSTQGLAEYAGSEDVEASIREIHRQTGAWCCVTQGADGVLIAAEDSLDRVAAFKVEVVDTLGAGDVWHGALALALAEGRAEAEAVAFANASAALKCQRAGGRDGVPNRTEVTAFLQVHGKDESSCN